MSEKCTDLSHNQSCFCEPDPKLWWFIYVLIKKQQAVIKAWNESKFNSWYCTSTDSSK